jgi:peptide/nickel transport system permease protein
MITEDAVTRSRHRLRAYQAMVAGDIPFTMFYLVFLIALTQVSLIMADILYAVPIPRAGQ